MSAALDWQWPGEHSFTVTEKQGEECTTFVKDHLKEDLHIYDAVVVITRL